MHTGTFTMTRTYVAAAVCCTLLLSLPARAELMEVPPLEIALAMASAGEVDEALFERVFAFVNDNFWSPLRIKDLDPPGTNSVEWVLERASALVDTNDVCILVLVDRPAGFPDLKERVHREKRAAVLNVGALRPAAPDAEDDPEMYGRRVEKEAMRVMGELLGLDNCNMPRCALHVAPNAAELDKKGRNLCPPCQTEALRLLRKKGVYVYFDRPAEFWRNRGKKNQSK
ncbi:hypothetical protein ACFLSJ_05510 [Verrucomicrobiota bacterium]